MLPPPPSIIRSVIRIPHFICPTENQTKHILEDIDLINISNSTDAHQSRMHVVYINIYVYMVCFFFVLSEEYLKTATLMTCLIIYSIWKLVYGFSFARYVRRSAADDVNRYSYVSFNSGCSLNINMQYTPQLPRLASRIDGSSSCSIRCRISLIKPWEYRISGAFYNTMENIVCNSVWASHKSRWAFDCSVNTIDDDNERKSADLVICKVNARHEFGVRIWDMSFLCCRNTGHGSSFFMLLADSRFGFDLEKAHLWWHCRFSSWCVNHPSANAFGKVLFDWFICTIEFVIVVKNEPADDSTQSLNQAYQTQCTPYYDWFTTYTLYILKYYKWRVYVSV